MTFFQCSRMSDRSLLDNGMCIWKGHTGYNQKTEKHYAWLDIDDDQAMMKLVLIVESRSMSFISALVISQV